jgi:hypothetical protein
MGRHRRTESFGRPLKTVPRSKHKKERKKQMTMMKAINAKVITGGAQAVRCLAVIIALAATAATARSDEPKGDAKSDNKLVGTWKMVSAKYGGQEFKLPEGVTMIKHVTATQFMWASYDKYGKVTRAAGGGYTLKGEVYEETPEYGISSDFDLIKGKAQKFKWKVEGIKWYHNGELSNGLTIEEVWERVEKK